MHFFTFYLFPILTKQKLKAFLYNLFEYIFFSENYCSSLFIIYVDYYFRNRMQRQISSVKCDILETPT